MGEGALTVVDRAVYVIGTLDTKGEELRYAANLVRRAGAQAILVDVSTAAHDAPADVTAEMVADCHPQGHAEVLGLADRGQAVTTMAEALTSYMLQQPNIGAVLGLGGSGNTAIVTTAMRALPVGVPKIMVSTLASGNVAPFVGPSDIMMMHAVADISGLNTITRAIIANAAHAAVGMVQNRLPAVKERKRPIGLTMFGVTTPAVTQIRAALDETCECFVFHATGIGGQCFEKLVDSGFLSAATDVTTTEVADFLIGGVLPCTADRFGAIIRTGIPYVGSLGACDMVNFGARESVAAEFQGRRLHIHNPFVTLMRTDAEENRIIGRWIVERLNRMPGPVRFLLPLRGVSAIDAAGQPFHDPAADLALFDAVRNGWKKVANHEFIEIDAHINSREFSEAAVAAFKEITKAP